MRVMPSAAVNLPADRRAVLDRRRIACGDGFTPSQLYRERRRTTTAAAADNNTKPADCSSAHSAHEGSIIKLDPTKNDLATVLANAG